MYRTFTVSVVTFAAMAGAGSAQPRTASIRGGGNPDQGKCTIEVVVDGAVDVEIRGTTANLRNLSGQPPQWRRFECNMPMPVNPVDFRFAGVDGRGRQQLTQDPRNGGPAVVRIEDPDNGSEGYTFDITWGNGRNQAGQDRGYGQVQVDPRGGYQNQGRDPRDQRDQDIYHNQRADVFRGDDWRGQVFQRVREDLDHVQTVSFNAGDDQYRLSRTRQALDELQGKLANGRYDQRQLDFAIGSLQKVVQDNRLTRRDRDVLNDDLNRLRDFRSRHDEFGAR